MGWELVTVPHVYFAQLCIPEAEVQGRVEGTQRPGKDSIRLGQHGVHVGFP